MNKLNRMLRVVGIVLIPAAFAAIELAPRLYA